MKKTLRASFFSAMALILIIALLAGCSSGKKEEAPSQAAASSSANSETPAPSASDSNKKMFNGVDVSEEVTLKMYMMGDESPDTKKVYEEINKMLKEDINATVELSFFT